MLLMKLSFIVDFFLTKLYDHVHNSILNSSDDGESFFSTSTLIYWIPYLHQFVGLCALGFELYRRGGFFNRQVPGAGGGAAEFTREYQQAKMNRMVELIHKVPLETFVSQGEEGEDEALYCLRVAPVSQLKRMLQRRGVSKGEVDSYVDRQNLIDRLKQCRQYSDTCCICFETFKEAEPIRVLPKCHHELHVECLDKWVYTFATTPSKLGHEPSCPMCKAELTMCSTCE
ncbi:MAG: hypothetical protein SGARI_005485 [Bacillariaceae sp.]